MAPFVETPDGSDIARMRGQIRTRPGGSDIARMRVWQQHSQDQEANLAHSPFQPLYLGQPAMAPRLLIEGGPLEQVM